MSSLLGAILLWSCAAQSEPLPVPAFQPALARPDLGKWWTAHAASGSEMPGQLRPWQSDLAQGAAQAWQERRPLLLWLEEGHPFAAAPARALTVREQWKAPDLAAPLRDFVLVADDLSEILRRDGPSAAWLRQVAGESPLQPGILLATPDGRRLGACDGLDAATIAAALDAALQRWEELAADLPPPVPAERPGPLPREPRDADAFPLDGLAFEILHRRLEDAAAGAPEEYFGSFSRDYFWMGAAESAALRPTGPGVNTRRTWPPLLAARLARAALADGAEGRWLDWSAADLQLAEVEHLTQARRQGRVAVQLTGRFVAQQGGAWQNDAADPFGAARWTGVAPGARGARAQALGWMELDAKTGAVLLCQFLVLTQHVDADGVRESAALVRGLLNGEEGMRYAPRLRESAAPPDGGLPHRTLFAEQEPVLDGSLAEPVWAGSPWSLDFAGAPGSRAKATWNADFLFLAAWTAAPELAIEVSPPEGGPALKLLLRADGSVEGLEGARCAVQVHGADDARAWVYELQLPWVRVNRALERDVMPQQGAVWSVSWRGAAGTLAARLVLEPSRAQEQSFGSGAVGGFR